MVSTLTGGLEARHFAGGNGKHSEGLQGTSKEQVKGRPFRQPVLSIKAMQPTELNLRIAELFDASACEHIYKLTLHLNCANKSPHMLGLELAGLCQCKLIQFICHRSVLVIDRMHSQLNFVK